MRDERKLEPDTEPPTRFEMLPEQVQSDLTLIIFWCEHYAGQDEADAVDRLTDYFGGHDK